MINNEYVFNKGDVYQIKGRTKLLIVDIFESDITWITVQHPLNNYKIDDCIITTDNKRKLIKYINFFKFDESPSLLGFYKNDINIATKIVKIMLGNKSNSISLLRSLKIINTILL